MNIRQLKGKRMECGVLQKDMADALHITQKAMSQKECSSVNKFRAEEMIIIAEMLKLTFQEFDSIFFDSRLTECLIFEKGLQLESLEK